MYKRQVINTVSLSLNDSEPVCIAAPPKSLTAKSGNLALANVPELILLALVVSVVAEAAKPLTAPLAIAMSTLAAFVIRPSASTVICATESASPYTPPVTAVAANCVAPILPAVTLISPELTVMPVPPEICALTSEALGPVYVITPVLLLYAAEPSPPASVTLM